MVVNTKNDLPLLENLKNGDPDAFRTIYVQWRKPIFSLLNKIMGSETDAEDITQDVFETLWTTRDRIDTSKAVKSYIYLIARQSAWKLLRRQRLQRDYLSSGEFYLEDHINSHDIIVAKETELLTELAIFKMPEKRREVYLLHYREGLSYGQIAEKMGLTNESVRRHLHEARKQIKNTLMLVAMLFMT